MKNLQQNGDITPQDAFELFTTFGFPLDVTQDLSDKKNIKIDQNKFDALMKSHKEIQKRVLTKKFNSGLSDNTKRSCTLSHHYTSTSSSIKRCAWR